MKKLKLTALSLGAKEVLTRVQLKNVLGGSGSGSGSGSGEEKKNCYHINKDDNKKRFIGSDYTVAECAASCSRNPNCSYSSSV